MSVLEASDMNVWISSAIKRSGNEALKNLFHLFNPTNLVKCLKAVDGSKALGVDGISKKEYLSNLKENLEKLMTELHQGSYIPEVKREVLIEKANGGTRPIAIGCIEDKMVEKLLSEILNAIYEPMFSSQSFGFRSSLSCHQAINETYKILSAKEGYAFVVEIDFANFFNTVNHRQLMKMLRKKIASKKLLSLIHRLLCAKIQHENGSITQAVVGTPQGGIASPILANVYLNSVVDQWFQERYGKTGKMVRYADDGLFFFKNAQAAQSFLDDFKQQVSKYKLKLNEEKTKIINMSKESMESFDFLGFTFYKGRNRKSRGRLVMIKTSKNKLIKTISNLTMWIKKNRSALKTKDLLDQLNTKLRGHYNYFGYWCNYEKLHRVYRETRKVLFKWLNRRSQLKSLTVAQFKLLAEKTILAPLDRLKLRTVGWSPYV